MEYLNEQKSLDEDFIVEARRSLDQRMLVIGLDDPPHRFIEFQMFSTNDKLG